MRADVVLAGTILVAALTFALTVDAVRTGFGLKGDEASYTAMALSAAYDHDLTFQRKDLDRFWAVYRCGPDGIFLKRGKMGRLMISSHWPFVRYMKWADAPEDKLYFGKAFIYPVMAAPFVWLFGLNGMLVFHVVLLAGVVACGYAFQRARGARLSGLVYTLAFIGISIVPVYAVWLTPEIFNLSLVVFGYFLWLYKEVAPEPRPTPGRRVTRLAGQFLRGPASDIVAALLLGMLTFSKPLYALLVGPVILWQLWRRRLGRAVLVTIVFVLTAGGLFAVNTAISGEANYQGGETGNRKVFYTWFPFESAEMTFDTVGYRTGTNELNADVYDPQDYGRRLWYNLGYFLFGRHAGFLPYFFPGFLAIVLWILRWRQARLWQVISLLAVAVTIAATLLILPFTWAGGGGPPGNRYFVPIYGILLYLTPPFQSVLPAALAWVGGAIFTLQLVVSPYWTARFPWRPLDHGPVRILPIELTMVNQLPIMLDNTRAPLVLQPDSPLSVYLLDENAYPPEPAGLWITARRRADVIVRTNQRLSSMRITLSSVVPNSVWVSFDGRATSVKLEPNQASDVLIVTDGGVYSERGWNYVLSVEASDGMVPKNTYAGSSDRRYLGVLVKLQGTVRKGP